MGILEVLGAIKEVNFKNDGEESNFSIKVKNPTMIHDELPYDAKGKPILIEDKKEDLNDNIEIVED